jgi:RNA polymerase sigma factor (sigma-70 family)
MEASTLTHAPRRGLFSRPTPLLKLQGDDKLVALTRSGNTAAFETLVSRYQGRLLGFCRQMLRSTEDAEDVLQEVFVAAYKAMVADERTIAVRPWFYRIARNRCLNHLRRPVPDGQDSMDVLPMENGDSVHDRVQNREEFRDLLDDVGKLPETQRSALLLREMDALSYEDIARSMDTTVPGVKSLLVRARIALAESTQARLLTCDEVKVELAEAAEGLGKAGGPVRRHVRDCDACNDFRKQLRSDSKALAALFPVPALFALKGAILSKLGIGGGGAGAAGGAGATAVSGGAAGGAAAGGAAAGTAAAGGAAAGGGIGAVGGVAAAGGAATAAGAGGAGLGTVGLGLGAVGTKVGVGLTSAVLLAGAAEVKHQVDHHPAAVRPGIEKVVPVNPPAAIPTQSDVPVLTPADTDAESVDPEAKPVDPATVQPVPVDPTAAAAVAATTTPELTTGGVVTTHKGRHKRGRKVATADSVNPSPVSSAPSSSSPSSTVGEADPAATSDPADGTTGGTAVPAP